MSRVETDVSAGISSEPSRSRGQQKEEPSKPSILANKINAKLQSLISSGAKVFPSKEGALAFLQASSSIFSYPEVPSRLRYLEELNLKDRMDVKIASQGYGIASGPPSALAQPLVSASFTLSPNINTQALVTLRIEQRGGKPLLATIRQEDPKLHVVTTRNLRVSSELLEFFLKSIDRTKPKWGGIEDYVEDLRELARGRRLSEESLALAEKALRIADVYLAGELRESGEPAIEHSYRSMRDAILAGVSDGVHLAVLAFHDVAEDSPTLRQDGKPYQPWYKDTKSKLLELLEGEPEREKIVRIVMAMTRPSEDGVEILTREEGEFMYKWNLMHDFDASFAKLFEHTDNVETLDALPYERQSRIIREKTIPYIENLFLREEVRKINPRVWRIGMKRLVRALKPYAEKFGIKIPPRIATLGR